MIFLLHVSVFVHPRTTGTIINYSAGLMLILPTILENKASPGPSHVIMSQSPATKCRRILSPMRMLTAFPSKSGQECGPGRFITSQSPATKCRRRFNGVLVPCAAFAHAQFSHFRAKADERGGVQLFSCSNLNYKWQ